MVLSLILFTFALSQERLDYEIKLGPFTIGSMRLEKLPPDTIASVDFEHFRAEVKLAGAISFLFWAEYHLETWCDKKELLPRRSYKRTKEKNYRSEWSASYEPGIVRYSDGKSYPLPDSARDILTLWFYLRTLDWKKEKSKVLTAHIDRKNWRLSFLVTGEEKVITPLGEFDCVVVSPQRESPIGTVFISQDRLRLPVVIRTRIGGFTATASLRGALFLQDQ